MTNKQIISRSIFLLSLIGVAASVSGCAQDVGIIDRTRPDYVKQSMFMNDDEWYFKQTVVGSDFQDSSGVTIGFYSPLRRIRWTVTEDTLFAYSSVEPSIGTSKGLHDPKDRRLGVVAAFPIKSHFDIQRGYNSSTGQVSNVISENSSDRLWNEREYMRVDWGNNQITDMGFLDGPLGHMASVSRVVPESASPSDYNRTRITDDIIDTVTEYYFEPDPVQCYLQFSAYSDCEAGPLSLRNFFWKIKAHNPEAYEPMIYTSSVSLDSNGKPVGIQDDGSFNPNPKLRVANISNYLVECTPEVKRKYLSSGRNDIDVCRNADFDMFKRFGYFLTQRTAYTPRRGSRPAEHNYKYANRWNIWQNAFKTNPDGSYVRTDDGRKVALDLSERKPKQIVYYLSPAFPENRLGIFNPKIYDKCGQRDAEGFRVDTSAVCSLQEEWNKVFTHTIALTQNYQDCDNSTVLSSLSSVMDSLTGAPFTVAYRNMVDTTKAEAFAKAYFDKALTDSSYFGKLITDGINFLDSNDQKSSIADPAGGLKAFCADAKKKYDSIKTSGEPAFKCDQASLSLTTISKGLVDNVKAVAETSDKGTNSIRAHIQKYLFYSKLANQLALDGVSSRLSTNADFKNSVCSSTDVLDSVKPLTKICDQNLFTDYGKDNCSDSLGDPALVAKFNFDAGYEKTKKRIAESNNGSDHMFVIRPNSCSWSQLTKWHEEHGDLNPDVKSLFAENKDRLDASKPNALPVNDLLKFCAKLEWYTKDEPKPEDRFDWQRTGDLRYSFINWVYENTGGWLGLGPVNTDPITGEIISGAANFSGNQLSFYTTYATDLNLYSNGTITDDDLISGRYAEDDPDALKELGFNNGASYLRAPTSLKKSSSIFGPADYDKTFNILKDGNAYNIEQAKEKLNRAIGNGGVDSLNKDYIQFRRLADNKAEALSNKIVNFMSQPDILSLFMRDDSFAQMYDAFKQAWAGPNANANTTLSPEKQKDLFSSIFSPIYSERRRQALQRKYQMMNIYTADAFQESLLARPGLEGSSRFYKEKGWDRSRIEENIAANIFLGVELHELGHTMGLRHNFSGSADALNYPAEYWDARVGLRKNLPANVTEMDDVNKQIQDGLDLMDDQKFKETVGYPLQNAGRKLTYFSQGEFRSSSIMDYGAAPNSDFGGLGPYDDAAIQFAYAKKIQVFNDESNANFDNFARILVYLHALDYRKLPNLFANGSFSFADSYQSEKDGVDKMVHSRKWIDVSEAQKQYVNKVKLNASRYLRGTGRSFDNGIGDNTVPYAFCSDDYNHAEAFCATFDYGATQREILGEKINTYRALKTYYHYRRGIYLGNPLRYVLGGVSSILYEVQQPFVRYSWLKRVGLDDVLDYGKDNLAASIDGINFMGELLALPDPGHYCAVTDSSKTVFRLLNGITRFGIRNNVSTPDSCVDSVEITRKDGVVDGNALGSSYWITLNRAGSFYDRYLALQSFFFIQGFDIRSMFNTDVSARNLSFWTEFQGSVYQLLHDLLLGNDGIYEGVINDQNQYEPPIIVSPEKVNDPDAVPHQEGMPHVFNPAAYHLGLLQLAVVYQILVNNTPYDAENDAIQYMKICSSNAECVDMCNKPWDPNDPSGPKIQCATFVHPDVPQFYTAPIAKDGRSISADIINHLNDVKPLYVDAREKLKSSPNDAILQQQFNNYKLDMQFYISVLDFIRNIMIKTRGLY